MELRMKQILALAAALLLLPLMATGALAQDNYRVKSGDTLRIEVLEDGSINRDVLVLPDGTVSVPLAGTLKVSGQNVDQIRGLLTEQLRPNFAADPTVYVSLANIAQAAAGPSRSTVEVFVIGEVNIPGRIEVPRGTTVLQLLADVGGFSKFAAKKRLQLRRTSTSGAEQIFNINYKDVLAGKTNIGMTVLSKGDVLIVPQRRLFE